MATKRKVSDMACFFETMQEVVGKHIANTMDFKEIKAAVMKTILKNKARGEMMTGRVEK
jgi:hypothetical protein